MELTKRTILITGGGSGIGFELTKQLLNRGNTVLITGRDTAKLARAKKQLPQIQTFQSDVSDPKAINVLFESVTKTHPELSVLINNAGIMRTINLHEAGSDLEDLTREIEINLNGPIRMVKQFLPFLRTKSSASHYECFHCRPEKLTLILKTRCQSGRGIQAQLCRVSAPRADPAVFIKLLI